MSRKNDWDAVESYFDYGLDVENRRVFLLGDVDENPIGNAIKAIYYLDGVDPRREIELFIGSFGGSEYEMFALYDVLMSVNAPISTVAMGKCMSAAPLLVAAGTKGSRYSMPNTQWMIHMGCIDLLPLRYDELRTHQKHLDAMSKRWYSLMELHTSLTATQWRRICKKIGDNFFDAEQAIDYGLVDHLWSEK